MYISSIHMLLPENKYLNIYKYIISFQGRHVIFF